MGLRYRFSYKYIVNYGDHYLSKYDENYCYDLPFRIKNRFLVSQGYNGAFSHQNINALDFKMSVGTEVTAIREGTVIKVVEKFNTNCYHKECQKANNLILIQHPDGTFAEYVHIKFNGSIVKTGSNVNKGQLIAYSGNVGWSTSPHLHLEVFKQKISRRETLKTMFRVGKGYKTKYLVQNKKYSRRY